MNRTHAILATCFGWFVACSGESPQPPAESQFETDADAPTELEGDGPQSHGVRKLTVDELQDSIPVAAGDDAAGAPIRWVVDVDGELVDALDQDNFGRILGRPDYVTLTEENPSPTAVYGKYARDMAREVCDAMVQADIGRAGEATLWRFAPHTAEPTEAEITTNVKYLVLRFLSLRVQEGDDVLDRYRQLYRASAVNTKGPLSTPQVEGWRGVCIGLFEDPTFHIH